MESIPIRANESSFTDSLPGVGAVKWENRAAWTDKTGRKRELLKLAELVALRVPPPDSVD